jgi:prolyl-tRNA synthetase
MDAIGCQEVLMPVLHPIEIYEESGRLRSFGPELFKLHDSRDRTFALGPTHEEVITMVARDDMKSYRSLPQCLYQILIKFRDEIRPRYGVVRAREFIMKDAYSFHESRASLDETYHDMERAYRKIIERCGLQYRMVEAESGYIGGDESHEFVVLAGSGESTILTCPCGYAVNIERASPAASAGNRTAGADLPAEKVDTPGASTVDEVSSFLGVSPGAIVKTLLYRTGERDVAVLVPGDREVNDIKLVKVFDDPQIRFLAPEEIERLTNAPVGFSGPVGLPKATAIYADHLVKDLDTMIVGANEAEAHLRGVKAGRDFTIDAYGDFVWAREGDRCRACGSPMAVSNGLEVGHIFKLGTKYSEAMNAVFLDEHGESHPFVMGCYGFGISRMVAAAIEQLHDDDGIVWPSSIAPFQLIILPVNMNDEGIRSFACRCEEELAGRGIETLLDDRDVSPGIKFKDADLIGVPFRLTIGKKLKTGFVELFHRATHRAEEIPLADAVDRIAERIGR